MNEIQFNKKVEDARIRVMKLDNVDGFEDRYLTTILFALKSGLMNSENNSHYEAYVMLEDLCNRYCKK